MEFLCCTSFLLESQRSHFKRRNLFAPKKDAKRTQKAVMISFCIRFVPLSLSFIILLAGKFYSNRTL